MKFALVPCLFLVANISGLAQSSRPAGVSSEWDVRKLLESLDLQAQHLKPIVDEVKPESWIAKGAPSGYVAQCKTAQVELRNLVASSDALSKQPEKLTLALDTYFRMQAMEATMGSVVEGVRKYQTPALAARMSAVLDENSVNRDRLRQYVQDLAAQKEQELQVADREAQRCRDTLVRQPAKQRRPVSK